MDELVRTANKGEWAELYVFFKIMLDRTLYAADEDLKPIENEWFKFTKLFRHTGLGRVQEYDLSEQGRVTIADGSGFSVLSTDDLSLKTQHIFQRIKESKATFAVNEAVSLMSDYGIKSVKAGSDKKTDIDAMVLISNTSAVQRMGFSVKAYVGGPPTLVNSSAHTNFTYEVQNYIGEVEEINEIEGRSKVRDRISTIVERGGSLRFDSMSSQSFRGNLRLQDTVYPKVMAEMLLNFFSGKGNEFDVLGKIVAENNELDLTADEIRTMTKRYLRSSALGMVPGTPWSGLLDTQGGYIVVLENGELICYNVYFDDDFQNYLYTNTRFDTPSTTKYKFGKLYSRDGKLYFDLNLQVRFKTV